MSMSIHRKHWWSSQYSVDYTKANRVAIIYKSLPAGSVIIMLLFLLIILSTFSYVIISENILLGAMFLLFSISLCSYATIRTMKRQILITDSFIQCKRHLLHKYSFEYFFTGFEPKDAMIESEYNNDPDGGSMITVFFRYFGRKVVLFSSPDPNVARSDAAAIAEHLGVTFNSY